MRIWYLPIYLLFFLLTKFRSKRMYKKSKKKNKVTESNIRYPMLERLARNTLFLCKVKVVFHNKDIVISKRNYLITPNHQSNYDPIILFACFRNYVMGVVAKEELLKDFRVNSFLKILYTFPMPRNDLRKSVKLIDKAREFMVLSKKSLLIFPEGERSHGKEMKSFKPGAFKIAYQAHCQILPVTIKNSYEINKNIFRRSVKVHVYFHKPLNYTSFINSNTVSLANRVQEIIQSKL